MKDIIDIKLYCGKQSAQMCACASHLFVADHAPVKHLRHQLMSETIQQEHRTAGEKNGERDGVGGGNGEQSGAEKMKVFYLISSQVILQL